MLYFFVEFAMSEEAKKLELDVMEQENEGINHES